MGALRPFRVRGLQIFIVGQTPLTRIAQARSDLSPAEGFAYWADWHWYAGKLFF
jgi:hypothetical protein